MTAQGGPAAEPQPPATARWTHHRPSVERAVPAWQQLRDSWGRVSAAVRKSVPARSILFVLPPLALPAVAFDLSAGRAVVVALLLLWLAAAAAVLCAIMLEGRDQLSLQSIERRLDVVANGGERVPQEALLAIGGQLDALSDRIDELTRPRPASKSTRPQHAASDQGPAALHHRPAEHWSTSGNKEHHDQYGPAPVPDGNWSEPRWPR